MITREEAIEELKRQQSLCLRENEWYKTLEMAIEALKLWVIGEDVYNTGYRQGRQDGYREGVKDGSDRTKEGHTGL